jgi:hypothetical protein
MRAKVVFKVIYANLAWHVNQRGIVREAELLDEIKRELNRARNLAIEAGGFKQFYFIEMALLEMKEIAKNRKAAREKALPAARVA